MQKVLFIFQTCDHCGLDPGTNKKNAWLWNGFYDTDTRQYVCWGCKKYHYEQKAKTGLKGLYSEMLVMA